MTNEQRSPKEIERDIERERAGLTNTLNDLQDKISVENVARQVSDQFREHGGDIGRSVSDAVKRNPVALALTGVGLAWLMIGDRSKDRDGYDRDRRYDRFERNGGHDDDRRDDDRVGRTGLPSRAATRPSRMQERSSHASRSPDASKPYYSGRYTHPDDTPSWMRKESDTEHQSMGSRMRDVASGASDSVTAATTSAADTARKARSTVADKARDAAGAMSDAGQSVAGSAQDLATAASDRATALRDRLAEGTENLSEEARNRVIAARESAIEARETFMTYTKQGRERAADIFEEQPLIAGALAVALGAALAAALPRSRVEDDYLGEQSDHLMAEAERIFEEEKQKLGKVADAATAEAKKIVGEAKNDADTAAKTVVDKAKTSGKRIVDAAESEAQKQNVAGTKKP